MIAAGEATLAEVERHRLAGVEQISTTGGYMYYGTEMSSMYRTPVSPMYPTGMSPMDPTGLPETSPAEKAQWARVSNGDGNGRERVPWGRELWDRIDRAVHDEMYRVGVGRRFLPLVPAAGAIGNVPADKITEIRASESVLLTVDESKVAPIVELSVEFALTKQQVAAEETLQTAVTLGTRAANRLTQAEDLVLFQGDFARRDPLFTDLRIEIKVGQGLGALANVDDPNVSPPLLTFRVDFADPERGAYQENTLTAVAAAYSALQDKANYGPYALVLPTNAYADAFAPLENTLITPSDPLRSLVEGRLYGTGTLPEITVLEGDPPSPKQRDVGLLLSLGGNTVDLAFVKAAVTDFVQEDGQGRYRFRVFEQFALRDKDTTGRAALLFQRKDPVPSPAPGLQGP